MANRNENNNKTNENNTVSANTQVMVSREQYEALMAAYATQQPKTSMRGLSFKEEMALAIVGGAFAVAASAIGAFGFAKAGAGLKSFSKSDFASGYKKNNDK